MKLLFSFIIILCFAQWTLSQDKNEIKYSKTITKEDLKKHLSIIASDANEGRNPGEKGFDIAAKYIEKQFSGDKLVGPVKTGSDPYFQEFELESKSWPKTVFTTGNTKLEQGKDIAFLNLVEGTNEYDIVFAGFGIFSDKYNDYKDLDVKDKIVAFTLGEPKTKAGKYLVTGTEEPNALIDTTLQGKFNSIQPKVMAIMSRGAKGFIIIDNDDKGAVRTIKDLNLYLDGPQMNFSGKGNLMPSIPMLYVSSATAANFFGTDLMKFQKAIDEKIEKGESPAGLFSAKIKIEAERKTESVKTGNVIGMVEGTDKKDEYVVIMAHFDHLGKIDGEIYNGADDNGSGTVSLIELAEAFAKAKADGKGPRRSVVFIALTCEEKGLLGSQYYSENPVFPISNTVTGLNIDMVGRIDKDHKDNGSYIYIIGDDRLSSELHTLSENASKLYSPDVVLDYKLNAKDDPEHLYERSDHYNFAKKGVPVIFYTSGLHDEYHTPKDDVELIDFPNYEKRVRLIFATAWQIANADERVKVDK
jgi:hypothetical protein